MTALLGLISGAWSRVAGWVAGAAVGLAALALVRREIRAEDAAAAELAALKQGEAHRETAEAVAASVRAAPDAVVDQQLRARFSRGE